jgi:hypothetical protein
MKKIIGITLASALIAMLCAPFAVLALPNKFTVDVPYGEPATSAIGSDWGAPNKAAADMLGWGGAVDDGIPFDYYLMWSEKGLYVATDINMPNPVALNDGSALEASHGGNCDRFQMAFNPGNERPEEEAPVWFTFSALEDGAFHIVREDAQYGEVEDVTPQCPGTAIINGGRFQTAFMIPWSVININSAPFAIQADFKMDIHVGICFAGDNAAEVTGGAEKIEAANVPDDLPNVWVTGAMPVTMNLQAPPPPPVEEEPETPAIPEPAPEAQPEAPAPVTESPAPAAPATGDGFTAYAAMVIAALVFAVSKKRKAACK